MASNGKEAAISPASMEPHAIDLDTTAASSDSQQTKSSWRHLFAFTKWSHAGPLAVALVASAFSAAIKTVLSVILGKIFDIVADVGGGTQTASDTLREISTWSLVLLGLGVANWLASTAFLALWILFGELQANAARGDILFSLLSREMAWFDSLDHGISSLLTRELQLATSQVLGLLVCDTMAAIASLTVAFYYSWKLTLVLLATLPVSIIVMSLATRRLGPAIQAQKRDLETASKLATASIKAIDLVKVFNGYDRELGQYYQAIVLAGRQYLVQAQCNALQMGYVSFWVISMFVVGFWYGVVLVDGGLAPGRVLTTFYATLAAFQGIEALLPHWLVLSKGMAAGAFLSSISTSDRGATNNNNNSGSVSFAYPSNPTKKVLNTSSFSFPAGEMTFIVGRSGSGKSTVGNLIANFYEPLTGTIWFDGQPLNTLDRQWTQANITLIQQLSVVFNDTVFNNIAVGHQDAESVTREEVLTACEFALLQSTLTSLLDGLDTHIGTHGQKLSGGQMQRLALARARLRDPKVLILDEVTSSLDQISRGLVMDAIREWRRDKTTIIITHDISQIIDDDFVYVMENASLVHKGFKRNLAQLPNGPFAAMDNLTPIKPTPSPIEISITSSDSTHSLSPIMEAPPSRASFVSQFILNELDSSSINPARNSRQISLGVNTAFALKMRKEQIWESSHAEEGPKTSGRVTQLVEVEKRYFSSLVDKHFSTPHGSDSPDLGPGYLPSPVESSFQLDSLEDSGYSEDDPKFVFGTAERRQNISSLRLVRTSDRLVSSDQVPTKSQPPTDNTLLATLKTLWPTLTGRDKLTFLVGLICCLIGAAATPVFSFCLAKLLGAMWSPENRAAEGKKWAIYLAINAVIDGVATGCGHYMLERVGQSWVNALRIEALKRILRQPKAWFDKEKNSASRINECLERNSEETRNIVGRFIPIITVVTGMISISVIWALAVSWKLTLVALAPLPVVIGAVKGYTVVSSKWETKCNEGAEDASAALNEIFFNIRVVRALTLEKHFGDRYRKLLARTLGLGMKRAGYTCGLFGLYQSMSYPLTALVFYYATVLLVKDKHITATQVLQVVNLLLFSIGTATDALSNMPQLTMAQATATQLLAYAKMPLEPPGEGQGGTKISNPLPIEVKDLTFSYSRASESQVLRGVSFNIERGSCTAIVGSSGCGKSTIISLLMGLYQSSRGTGQLSFGGIPYSDLDRQHLRSTMAYVSQSPFLFPATVAENLVYGLPQDSPHRDSLSIYGAAQAAGIHDFIISLPQGYATLVGDGGLSLSGGQAQRLSIARALVRQPRLLILDEPTSALDAECSSMIRETISQLVQRSRDGHGDMAIVMVTHTKEMMQVADNIVVIDRGIKVEEGSYDELWQAGGPFRHLVSGGEWHGGED